MGEVLIEYTKKASKDSKYEHVSLTKEGVIPKSKRYDRDSLVRNEEKEYRITRYNDICYNPANLKFGVICRNSYGNAIFSPIYVTFVIENAVPNFMGYFVKREEFIKNALRYQEGTVYERMAVKPSDLCNLDIVLPHDYEEEKSIGELLLIIDNIITFQQCVQQNKID